MKGYWLPLLLVVAGSNMSGCKPKADPASEVRSLDNFTRRDGETLTTNRCGPAVAEVGALKKNKIYSARYKMIFAPGLVKDEILATLAAVPEPIQAIFFGVGGSIQASSNLKSKCSFKTSSEKDFADEKTGAVTSCWRKKADESPPVIFVESRPEAIRHGLLRSFSFVYTQLFVESAAKVNVDLPQGDKKRVLSAALERFQLQKKLLVEGLLRDSANLGKEASVHLKNTQKTNDQFGDYVVAEALDSFYCSKSSNASMQAHFKDTFQAMTKGSGEIGGIAHDLGKPWYIYR